MLKLFAMVIFVGLFVRRYRIYAAASAIFASALLATVFHAFRARSSFLPLLGLFFALNAAGQLAYFIVQFFKRE